MTSQKMIALTLVFAMIALLPCWAQAAPVTEPVGETGPYRLVFVTSDAPIPAPGGTIDVYNTYVASMANSVPELAALGTTWSAMVATSAVDVWTNTATNPVTDTSLPIYRLDGAKVSDGYTAFWDGDIDVAIDISETGGAPGGGTQVVAGFDAMGATWPGEAMDDTVPRLGYRDSTGDFWAGKDAYPGDNNHLYAISGVINDTVETVPEPSTFLLSALGLVGFIGLRRRRKNRG